MNQYIPYKKQKSIDIPLTGEIVKLTWSERNQSKDQILKQLENYIEIGIIEEIPINTYVRYLTLKDRKITLRYGGFLKIVKNEYVVLENNGQLIELDENNLDRRRPNIRDALQALIGSYMCHMW